MAHQEAAAWARPRLPYELPFTFSFEEDFDVEWACQWIVEHTYLPILIIVGLYLPLVYIGPKLMANRKPMDLRRALIAWNLALSIFSAFGFLRVAPDLLHSLSKFGFKHTICDNSYLKNGPVALWGWLFVLSKLPELLDTLFLVLRKRKLIFLHVYHHTSVILFSWFVSANRIGSARWFCSMNYFVHALMYAYYALKATPNLIRIPKWVSMIITGLQILQMQVGACLTVANLVAYISGERCATSKSTILAGLIIYGSYMLMFMHFFYTSYLATSARKRAPHKRSA